MEFQMQLTTSCIFLALHFCMDLHLSENVSDSFLLYMSDSFPSYRITLCMFPLTWQRLRHLQVMVSLEAPFESTCPLLFSKCLWVCSSYLPGKSYSCSSRELKAMNVFYMPPLLFPSPWDFSFLALVVSQKIQRYGLLDCQYLDLF